VTDSAESEARAAAAAAKLPVPIIYGTPSRMADAVARWRDEVIIPDRAIPAGPQRRDARDALADALKPLA
jgi:hypothetical protein